MGLTDRFKELKSKAEDAVLEHSEQIHGAVEKATTAADQRTGGKYRERINKVGAKANDLVDSLKDTDVQDTDVQDTDVQDTDVQDTDVQEASTQDTNTQDTNTRTAAEGGEQTPSA